MHFLCASVSMCARWPSLTSCGSAVQRCWSFTAVVVALVTCWVSTVLRLCIAGMIWCHRCLAINGHRWGQRNVKKWRVRCILFGSWIETLKLCTCHLFLMHVPRKFDMGMCGRLLLVCVCCRLREAFNGRHQGNIPFEQRSFCAMLYRNAFDPILERYLLLMRIKTSIALVAGQCAPQMSTTQLVSLQGGSLLRAWHQNIRCATFFDGHWNKNFGRWAMLMFQRNCKCCSKNSRWSFNAIQAESSITLVTEPLSHNLVSSWEVGMVEKLNLRDFDSQSKHWGHGSWVQTRLFWPLSW